MTTEEKLVMMLLHAAVNRSPCYCGLHRTKDVKCGRCHALEAYEEYILRECA